MSIIIGLQEENTLLKSKLENMTKYVWMLNNGSNALDEIQQVGKSCGNLKGIGFNYGTVNKEIKIPCISAKQDIRRFVKSLGR